VRPCGTAQDVHGTGDRLFVNHESASGICAESIMAGRGRIASG